MAASALGPGGRVVDAVTLADACLDLCLGYRARSPSAARPLLAAGLVDGSVELHALDYGEEGGDGGGSSCLWRQRTVGGRSGAGVKTCSFSAEHARLVAGTSSGALHVFDAESGAYTWSCERAHAPEGINTACFVDAEQQTQHHEAVHLLASGDDEGVVKLWDMRQPARATPLRTMSEQSDYVSALALGHDTVHGAVLLSAAADGTLAVYSLERHKQHAFGKAVAVSDEADDELLSLAVLKGGRKVVCGTQLGALSVFSWGEWDAASDRYPGHPSSVDSLVKIDEDTVLTGSSDGVIRIVQVQPNALLGVVGATHDDMPIERLDALLPLGVVACCGHSNVVRLYDILYLFEDEGGDGEDENEDEQMEERGDDAEEEAAAAADVPKMSERHDDTARAHTQSAGAARKPTAEARGTRGASKREPASKQPRDGAGGFFDEL